MNKLLKLIADYLTLKNIKKAYAFTSLNFKIKNIYYVLYIDYTIVTDKKFIVTNNKTWEVDLETNDIQKVFDFIDSKIKE